MLEWKPSDGILRAYDEYAMYVIWTDDDGHFMVGYFPAPGPECHFSGSHALEAAKESAELCAEMLRHIATH